MAIQIIKNTMVDPIEMTCECCKSVFSYNYQDIQRKQETTLFNFNPVTKRFITCPVCKYDNELDRVVVESPGEACPEESEDKPEEETYCSETYCSECEHFESIISSDSDWFGARCKLDDHESAPSMYAISSLNNACPLKKEETDE